MKNSCWRILYDMSDLDVNRKFYSINIYKYRFLDSLNEDEFEKVVLFLNKSNAPYLTQKYPRLRYVIYDRCLLLKLFARIPRIKNRLLRFLYLYYINNSKCSVFLSASNIDFRLTWPIKIPRISVIHDIKAIWEMEGEAGCEEHSKRMTQYYYDLISNSSRVIAISHYTRESIVDHLPGIDKSKLLVIYNSVKKSTILKNPFKGNVPRYILYVNSLYEYKNIETLIKAFNVVYSKFNCKLVVVGKNTPYWVDIQERYQKMFLEGRIIHFSNIEEGELNYLYKNASLFISPSLKEGFGYTPIEAAISGCPVLCSKCEALPETTLGMVSYYNDPMDDVELSDKMTSLLVNPPTPQKLQQISTAFERTYSPIYHKECVFKLLNSCIS